MTFGVKVDTVKFGCCKSYSTLDCNYDTAVCTVYTWHIQTKLKLSLESGSM